MVCHLYKRFYQSHCLTVYILLIHRVLLKYIGVFFRIKSNNQYSASRNSTNKVNLRLWFLGNGSFWFQWLTWLYNNSSLSIQHIMSLPVNLLRINNYNCAFILIKIAKAFKIDWLVISLWECSIKHCHNKRKKEEVTSKKKDICW